MHKNEKHAYHSRGVFKSLYELHCNIILNKIDTDKKSIISLTHNAKQKLKLTSMREIGIGPLYAVAVGNGCRCLPVICCRLSGGWLFPWRCTAGLSGHSC